MPHRLVLFIVFMISAACSNPAQQIEVTGQTMGTTYRIVVSDSSGNLSQEQVQTAVDATLETVNANYSNWDPNSEVSRFNASGDLDFIEITPGLQLMLDVSDQIHQATRGRFDLTLTPLIELWGFGPSGTITQQPDEAEIQVAQEKVGQDRVIERSPDGQRLRKTNPDATIYLTALAKGYGIDAVAEHLSDIGADDFMVEIGGDLYVSGQTRRASDWLIGIERPGIGMRDVQEIVALTNVGMATSGDYRNYFEQDGIRFSHIIDPTTGKPITHRTASVTVIAKTAAEADAWATALLAVGADEGLSIAAQNDVDALFIVRQTSRNETAFDLIATPGFETYRAKAEN